MEEADEFWASQELGHAGNLLWHAGVTGWLAQCTAKINLLTLPPRGRLLETVVNSVHSEEPAG